MWCQWRRQAIGWWWWWCTFRNKRHTHQKLSFRCVYGALFMLLLLPLYHSLIKIEYMHIVPHCYVEQKTTKIVLGNSKQWIASAWCFSVGCFGKCVLRSVCTWVLLLYLYYTVFYTGKSANSLHLTNLRCALLCSEHTHMIYNYVWHTRIASKTYGSVCMQTY